MKFIKTNLEDLYIIKLISFHDGRGSFSRTFCKNEFEKIGLKNEFVQINQSINLKKGTFRGLHYQVPPFEDDKLIRCISGSVFDIIVDLRSNSKTFLEHFSIELSAKNQKMLFVPKGFAHGFLTLEDDSQLIYHHTSFYQPGFEGGINYKDPKIDIELPISVEVVSKKDMEIPFLSSKFNGI